MGNISIVKIADVAKYRKDFITIDNHKDYKRCRVQLHKRGVLLRDIVKGNYIKTKKQRVCKKDDFIFAEMDAKFGGYGIIPKELEGAVVSSHYYLFELDRSKVLPDYLSVLIDTDVIQSQIKAKGSTNYSRVSPSEVLEFEIPCPHIEEQKRVISFYLNAKNTLLQLNEENSFQQKYFSQLRQSILQDAIEGKLTVAWRKKNPVKKGDPETDAAALLEKIKKEKQKLIAEGKIKKDKPLAPIKAEEIPFKLPSGWLWARLGECTEILGGYAYDSTAFIKIGSNQVLRLGNIRDDVIRVDQNPVYIRDELATKTNLFRLVVGDIVITMTGTRNKHDYLYTTEIKNNPYMGKNLFLNQRLGIIRMLLDLVFIKIAIKVNTLKEQIFLSSTGSANQANIGIIALKNWMIPLPPLAEQRAIVERVDELLRIVDELEKEAAARQILSEDLMQAVLKEAFEGGGEI